MESDLPQALEECVLLLEYSERDGGTFSSGGEALCPLVAIVEPFYFRLAPASVCLILRLLCLHKEKPFLKIPSWGQAAWYLEAFPKIGQFQNPSICEWVSDWLITLWWGWIARQSFGHFERFYDPRAFLVMLKAPLLFTDPIKNYICYFRICFWKRNIQLIGTQHWL